jgi:hypothetical protein
MNYVVILECRVRNEKIFLDFSDKMKRPWSMTSIIKSLLFLAMLLHMSGCLSPHLTNRARVISAIAHWKHHTTIRFIERTNEIDFLTFQTGTNCSSSVERRGGQQFINVANDCTTGNTIHEIGHPVGLRHTHSREDRNSYVTVNFLNIIPDTTHNFNQHITDGTDIGQYDYWSIMHYGATAFSQNGEFTIVTTGGQPIGQRTGLSAGDLAAVAASYDLSPSLEAWTGLDGNVRQLVAACNKDGRGGRTVGRGA